MPMTPILLIIVFLSSAIVWVYTELKRGKHDSDRMDRIERVLRELLERSRAGRAGREIDDN